MNQYLIYTIVGLLIVVAIMGYVIRLSSGKIDRLNTEIGSLNESLAVCQRINEQNTEEFKKLSAARDVAQKAANENSEKIRQSISVLNKHVMEISNAKDNGPIPGVLQRTIDGVRSRQGTGS
jgi:predicted Holliday junction resolvase-like endonuclease